MIDHQTMGNMGYSGFGNGQNGGMIQPVNQNVGYPYQRPMLSDQVQRKNMSYPDPPDGPQIPARIYCQESNMRPNEVPSDGTLSAFIKQDCSCIYLKQVNNKGTIDELKYVPERKEEPVNPEATPMVASVDLSPIMERLDKIEGYLNHYKPNYKKPYPKQQKVVQDPVKIQEND